MSAIRRDGYGALAGIALLPQQSPQLVDSLRLEQEAFDTQCLGNGYGYDRRVGRARVLAGIIPAYQGGHMCGLNGYVHVYGLHFSLSAVPKCAGAPTHLCRRAEVAIRP